MNVQILKIEALDNGAHENQTYHGVLPDEWALIPDDMETPNFPFGDVEVEEVIHYRDVQVIRDVVKTREVEQLREVIKTREVPAVDDDGNPVLDDDGNPIMTTEEYTAFEPYIVTEEYIEKETVTEQEPYGVMTVTKWIAGELPEPATPEPADPEPTMEERVAALEDALAATDETAIELYEAMAAQEEINTAQDDALIELYEMIGG